jgi:hypothetical protein
MCLGLNWGWEKSIMRTREPFKLYARSRRPTHDSLTPSYRGVSWHRPSPASPVRNVQHLSLSYLGRFELNLKGDGINGEIGMRKSNQVQVRPRGYLVRSSIFSTQDNGCQ